MLVHTHSIPLLVNPQTEPTYGIGLCKISDFLPESILYGVVRNLGDADATFRLLMSSDCGKLDAWAAQNILVRGSSVASTGVAARGYAEFVFAVSATTEAYLRFDLSGGNNGLVLLSFYGNRAEKITKREIQALP